MEGVPFAVGAGQLHRLGEEVRVVAAQLLAGAEVEWHSLAASAFRARLSEESLRVRRCADEVDAAAAALAAHGCALRDVLGAAGPGGAVTPAAILGRVLPW
jgi:hypothetical protein